MSDNISADILKNLKDINTELKRLNTNYTDLNKKVDQVHSDLTTKYDSIVQENSILKSRVKTLEGEVERLEGYSCLKNLKIDGIVGIIIQDAEVTELKVRQFLQDTLELPNALTMPFEYSFRIKGRKTVIARFLLRKDRDLVFKTAIEKLPKGGNVKVMEDFTKRVRKERKYLGEFLKENKEENDYISLRKNRLIINQDIYAYDWENEFVEKVGIHQRRPRSGTIRGTLTGEQPA